MSILPSLARHRAPSPAEVRQQNSRLAAENERLRNSNRRLLAERAQLEAQLDAAAIDYSGALEDLRTAREENQRLRAAAAQPARVLPLHQSPQARKEAS